MFHNMLISCWISTALMVLKRRAVKCVDNGKVFHRLLTWFSTNLSSILSALHTPRLVGAGRHIFRHLSEPFWKTAISSCQHQSYFPASPDFLHLPLSVCHRQASPLSILTCHFADEPQRHIPALSCRGNDRQHPPTHRHILSGRAHTRFRKTARKFSDRLSNIWISSK